MPENILVLSYKFPPYEKIGARRWAKFAKYFVNKGYTVHVITNNWKIKNFRSSSQDDIDRPGIIIKRFQTPFNYFKSGKKIPDKIINKIEYLLSKMFNWTDEAYPFYVFNFRKIVAYLEKNNISKIIATGGPFSSNYFASMIKRKSPSTIVIQDFRDLWTEEEAYFYEFKTRGPLDKIYRKEIKMEEFSLRFSDRIVSVTPGCLSRLERKAQDYGLVNKKYSLIENGFDETDKKQIPSLQ